MGKLQYPSIFSTVTLIFAIVHALFESHFKSIINNLGIFVNPTARGTAGGLHLAI